MPSAGSEVPLRPPFAGVAFHLFGVRSSRGSMTSDVAVSSAAQNLRRIGGFGIGFGPGYVLFERSQPPTEFRRFGAGNGESRGFGPETVLAAARIVPGSDVGEVIH